MTENAPATLYVGKVTHRRLQPMGHRFRYRTYSLLVDVARIDEAARRSPVFSHNRWNIFSLHDEDYGPRDGSPLRPWIDRQLEEHGIETEGGSVYLLSFPRILGYAFNPLTIWFCHDAGGSLRAVLYEIHNTFGHSHSHLVPVTADEGKPLRHSFAKELHVSPFFDRSGGYTFTLRQPGERFSVSIDYRVEGDRMLKATMATKRVSFGTAGLLRIFATHPLLTLKVTAGIHWNALVLWLRGAKYRPVPAPPEHAVRFEGTLEAA